MAKKNKDCVTWDQVHQVAVVTVVSTLISLFGYTVVSNHIDSVRYFSAVGVCKKLVKAKVIEYEFTQCRQFVEGDN